MLTERIGEAFTRPRVARRRGRETKFGAFLDSTMDRYSDMLLYMGLLLLYARLHRTGFMVELKKGWTRMAEKAGP